MILRIFSPEWLILQDLKLTDTTQMPDMDSYRNPVAALHRLGHSREIAVQGIYQDGCRRTSRVRLGHTRMVFAFPLTRPTRVGV